MTEACRQYTHLDGQLANLALHPIPAPDAGKSQVGARGLPPISIQWVVIVKYTFMHLECQRLQVKAGWASFHVLSSRDFFTASSYKLLI